MHINSFDSRYNLKEITHYITEVSDNLVYVLELLIGCPIELFNSEKFGETIKVETNDKIYTFSNYKVTEYYKEGNYLKVVCVK